MRPDQIAATIILLDLPTAWFHVVQPGNVMCTTANTADPQLARDALRRAKLSGLHV